MKTLNLELLEKFKDIGISHNKHLDSNRFLYLLVEHYENLRTIEPNGYYYLVSKSFSLNSSYTKEKVESLFEELKDSLYQDSLRFPGLEFKNLSAFVYKNEDEDFLIITSKRPVKTGEIVTSFLSKKMPASFLKNEKLSFVVSGNEINFKIPVIMKGHYETFNADSVEFEPSKLVIKTEEGGDSDESDIQLELEQKFNGLFNKHREDENVLVKNMLLHQFILLPDDEECKQGNIRIYLQNDEIMIEALYSKDSKQIF